MPIDEARAARRGDARVRERRRRDREVDHDVLGPADARRGRPPIGDAERPRARDRAGVLADRRVPGLPRSRRRRGGRASSAASSTSMRPMRPAAPQTTTPTRCSDKPVLPERRSRTARFFGGHGRERQPELVGVQRPMMASAVFTRDRD